MIRVMVADDNTDLNNMYCKFLTKDKDIKIISQTTDGKETLDKYLELKPDLLLLDLEMPTLSGLDVIHALSEIPKEKNLKNIIVISGKSVLRAELWNMSKIYMSFQKPVDLDTIHQKIREFIKEREINFREISRKEITLFLYEVKINSRKRNLEILVDSIQTAYKNPRLLLNINDLYNEIGKTKNISSISVQYSIRNSMRSINKNISSKHLKDIFHLESYDNAIAPKYFFQTTIEYFKKR